MSDQMTDEDVHDIYEYPNHNASYEEIMERAAEKLRAADEEYKRIIAQKQNQEEIIYDGLMKEYIEIEYEDYDFDYDPFALRAIRCFDSPHGRRSQNKIKKILEAIVCSSPEEIAALRAEDSPEFRAIYRFLTRDRNLDPKLSLTPARKRQSQSTGQRLIQI